MSPDDKRKTLAKIHIAKKELGLDDDTYRAMLIELTGKRSTTQMTDNQLGKVLHHLKKRGFKPKPTGAAPGRRMADDPESKKIRALWLFLFELGLVKNPAESALAAYVKRQTGVEDLHWAKGDDALKVIETLKKWAMRELPQRVKALNAAVDRGHTRTIRAARHALGQAIDRNSYDAWLRAYEEIMVVINRYGIPLEEGIRPRVQSPAPVGSAEKAPLQNVGS